MTKKNEMTQAISSTSTERTKCDSEQRAQKHSKTQHPNPGKFPFGGEIAVVLKRAARINHWGK